MKLGHKIDLINKTFRYIAVSGNVSGVKSNCTYSIALVAVIEGTESRLSQTSTFLIMANYITFLYRYLNNTFTSHTEQTHTILFKYKLLIYFYLLNYRSLYKINCLRGIVIR